MRLESLLDTGPGRTGDPTGAESPPGTSRSHRQGHLSLHMNSVDRDNELHVTDEKPGVQKCK